MKNIFLLSLLAFCFVNASAQKLWLTSFAGTSNYQGELQDKSFTFNQSHFAAGLGLSYEVSSQLSLTGGVKFGKISGDDSKSKRNQIRNLNFTSSVKEVSLGIEYTFFNLTTSRLSPYVFGGVALFHFNPFTNDTLGNRVFLAAIGTEGQGFNGVKKYALTQVSIPMGVGLKFAINNDVRMGIEAGFRKTFTDYLDDVSSKYVDKNTLQENNGGTAVELAFRTGELKNGATYPVAGTLRGNAKTNDWYYFTGISLSFRLGGDKMVMAHSSKSKMGCPTAL